MTPQDTQAGGTRAYVLVEVCSAKPIPDLADKVAGRIWPIAEYAHGVLLTEVESRVIAATWMEKGRG